MCCFLDNIEVFITLIWNKGVITIEGIVLNKIDILKTVDKCIISKEETKILDCYGNSHITLIGEVSKDPLGYKNEIIDSRKVLKTPEFIEQLYKYSNFIK